MRVRVRDFHVQFVQVTPGDVPQDFNLLISEFESLHGILPEPARGVCRHPVAEARGASLPDCVLEKDTTKTRRLHLGKLTSRCRTKVTRIGVNLRLCQGAFCRRNSAEIYATFGACASLTNFRNGVVG